MSEMQYDMTVISCDRCGEVLHSKPGLLLMDTSWRFQGIVRDGNGGSVAGVYGTHVFCVRCYGEVKRLVDEYVEAGR